MDDSWRRPPAYGTEEWKKANPLTVAMLERKRKNQTEPETLPVTVVVTDADTGEVLTGTPLTPHEQELFQERIAPYDRPLPADWVPPRLRGMENGCWGMDGLTPQEHAAEYGLTDEQVDAECAL